MEMIGQVFNTIFLNPIHNILAVFYKLFLTIQLPGAFGFAIVALVVLIRFILHPFFKQQLETSKKMQELKPRLDALTVKYKKEPKQLQAEQMKLYQEAGINPAAGCLFMLIQIPVFIALYNTLNQFLTGGGEKALHEINKSLYFPALKFQTIDPHFFGFNLASSPQSAGIWYYYLVPVITAILQYYQAVVSLPQTSHISANKDASKDDKDKKPDTSGDFQKAMNTQMKYILPVMIGYFSFTLPVGLSLYWNIFSLFSILQYKLLHKKVGDKKLSVLEEKKFIQLEKAGNKKKKK